MADHLLAAGLYSPTRRNEASSPSDRAHTRMLGQRAAATYPNPETLPPKPRRTTKFYVDKCDRSPRFRISSLRCSSTHPALLFPQPLSAEHPRRVGHGRTQPGNIGLTPILVPEKHGLRCSLSFRNHYFGVEPWKVPSPLTTDTRPKRRPQISKPQTYRHHFFATVQNKDKNTATFILRMYVCTHTPPLGGALCT